MKIVSFFCILLILRLVDGLLCNGLERPMHATVNSSNILGLKHFILQNREPTEQNICQVYLNYSTYRLEFAFTKVLNEFPQINGKLLVDTTIESRNNTPIQQNTLQHSCSTHDYCEIDVLFHHLDWFINNGYNDDLVKHIFPLLNVTKNSSSKISIDHLFISYRFDFYFLEKCHSTSDLITCANDEACVLIWEKYSLQRGCTSNSPPTPMTLQIHTNIDLQTLQEQMIIGLKCNYEQCNNDYNLQDIKYFVEQYSNIKSIREAITNDRPIETTTFTTTTTDLTTEKSTRNFETTMSYSTHTTTIDNSSKSSVHRAYFLTNICAILFFIFYEYFAFDFD